MLTVLWYKHTTYVFVSITFLGRSSTLTFTHWYQQSWILETVLSHPPRARTRTHTHTLKQSCLNCCGLVHWIPVGLNHHVFDPLKAILCVLTITKVNVGRAAHQSHTHAHTYTRAPTHSHTESKAHKYRPMQSHIEPHNFFCKKGKNADAYFSLLVARGSPIFAYNNRRIVAM